MSHSAIDEILEEIDTEIERLRARLAAGPPSGGLRAFDFSPGAPETAPGLPELDHISRLLGEARELSFTVPAGAVRDRVRAIVASWAGLAAEVVAENRKISEVWDANPRNPRLEDGILSVLVRELKAAFPGVDFVLGAIAGTTAAALTRYVENRI